MNTNNLDEVLTAIEPFNLKSTSVELKCQCSSHMHGHECEEFITYDRGCEPIELNMLVLEACEHHDWDADKMLCPVHAIYAEEEQARDAAEFRAEMARDEYREEVA